MDLDSVTLLAAMIAAGGAALGALAPGGMKATRPAAVTCIVLAVALGGFSLVYHWLTGHDAASDEPMGAWRFVASHPAYVAVAAVTAGSALLLLVRRPATR